MTTAEADAVFDRFDVSRESRQKIDTYVTLLLSWQQRINLIGPATATNVWQRHICDSLQLLPLLPPNTSKIAELGSGAGIPGLVLAMAAGLEAHLYESNGKKAAFLREAARQTGTKAVVHNIRLESLREEPSLPKVQCVVARALAPLPLLLDYAAPFLSRGAVGLFHKGQDVDTELTEATKYWRIEVLKHASQCDSRGVILEIREASRV
ncbi:MAG: 16S rRNA (guanine(527)-N(7))-methyltransferase RsmG [Aestuariivirga sp.]|jgi:16S rRNA (guanine527-N7)-methyltransferase|uniref:16S rRNA (guanine(527)-N(7))-methyltransferase RsmG n=1 Tax=Aestuariivirga sp. TaxID=2650926 RepID=UPI00301729E5